MVVSTDMYCTGKAEETTRIPTVTWGEMMMWGTPYSNVRHEALVGRDVPVYGENRRKRIQSGELDTIIMRSEKDWNLVSAFIYTIMRWTE